MANTPSALKRVRQSEQARQRNAAVRSTFRTAVKKVHLALEQGDAAAASDLLRQATRSIDKAKTKGVLKANTAKRKISRLARAVAQKSAAAGTK